MLVGDLTEEQKASVREKIDEKIHVRKNGKDVTVLTAPLNIGLGTNEDRIPIGDRFRALTQFLVELSINRQFFSII